MHGPAAKCDGRGMSFDGTKRKEVHMTNAQEFAALAQLPEPLLTVYINSNPGLATNCRAVPGYIAWLKTEAKNLRTRRGETKSSLLHEQVSRVEKYLDAQRPAHTGVVIFSGPDTWRVIPLQVEPVNELHWGKPHLWQLTSIMERRRPACAVVLDLAGAHMYEYASGVLTLFAKQLFKVDTSQWRQKEHAHMARQGTRMPHGAQRDLFDRRIQAEYVHLLHDVASMIAAYCDRQSIDQVYLLGSDRLTKQVQVVLPQRLKKKVARIAHVSAEEPAGDIQARIESRLREFETTRKEQIVDELINRNGEFVSGMDETFKALQRGLLASLVLAEGFNPKLHQCEGCGLVTASSLPGCPACNGLQKPTTLHEALPVLLIRHTCHLDLVTDRAATRLQTMGGIGGRLRTLKRRPASAPLAPVTRNARNLAHLA